MRWPEAWLSGARPYALLLGLSLLLYLPGLSTIPPLDRDEARFAQATRQMLQTGDFLRIRFMDEARNNKPAGIYWLQAAAVAALSTPDSTAMWPYRIPSLLGATAAGQFVLAFGAALFGAGADPVQARRIGIVAAVLLACALGVVAEAHIAKTDAMLLAAVTAAQGAMGLAYVRRRAGRPVAGWIAAAFWVAEVAALLLKGPVGPGLAIVTAATLAIADRSASWLRSLRPVAGLIATAIVVLPWLIAIEQATAGHFLAGSVGRDFFGKVFGAQESHGAPPLSYLLLAFATFWPGSLILVPALLRGWRRRQVAAERFLLAWLVPGWMLLEIVPTKLPHYVLPLFPALALLAGAALVDGAPVAAGIWSRRAERAGIALWAVATLSLAALLIGLSLRFGDGPGVADVAGVVLVMGLAALLLRGHCGALPRTVLAAALSAAFVVPAALGVLPGLDKLWISRAAASLVAQHPPRPGAPIAAIGYSEPSLVFLLRGEVRFATPQDAAETLERGGEALVTGRQQSAFLQALDARRLAAQALGSIAGIDYSNGQHIVLTLYRAAPG